MMYFDHQTQLERAKRNGPKIASHPAWELNARGVAVPKKLYRNLHIALLLPLVIDALLRDQVLLIYGGYGDYQFFMKVLAAAVTIGAIWFAAAIWKSDLPVWGSTFVILLYAFSIYSLVLYLAYSTVPKIATRIAAEPVTIETDLYAVQSDRSVGKVGLIRQIFGRDQKYCYMIPKQPTLVSYNSNDRLGQRVHSGGSRFIHPTSIYFTGQANWFGLRVQSVSLSRPVPVSEIPRIRLLDDFDSRNGLPRSC